MCSTHHDEIYMCATVNVVRFAQLHYNNLEQILQDFLSDIWQAYIEHLSIILAFS
jgi:hypothetical protein